MKPSADCNIDYTDLNGNERTRGTPRDLKILILFKLKLRSTFYRSQLYSGSHSVPRRTALRRAGGWPSQCSSVDGIHVRGL